MSDTMATVCKKVFHIRPEPSPGGSSDNVDAILAATSLSVDVCPDVYRGLARLCRDGTREVCGVIVCVDGLGAAELAFFGIVSRVRHGVDLLVYADDPSSAWINAALERGATGLATEQAIQALDLKADPPPPPAVEALPVTAEDIPDEHRPEPNRDTAARVPWLRYDDRPDRAAPRAAEEPADVADSIDPGTARSASYEPLLTDEELRALVGGDIGPTTLGDDPAPVGEAEEFRGDGSGASRPGGGEGIA